MKTTKGLTRAYEEMVFFQKMKANNYRTGKEITPLGYDYEKMPRKVFAEFPSERSIMILNDILEIFQKFYGVTIDEIILERRCHWQSILRSHLFWFVRFYNRLSEYDSEMYRFKVSNTFIANMFSRNHPMAYHGEKAINLMLETEFEFRKSHDELFDLLQEKLERYELG